VNRLRLIAFTLVLRAVCLAQSEPSLDKTVDYMASILDTAGDGQEILFGEDYRKEPCRLFVSDTITYAVTKPAKEYKLEVQFPLSLVDPGTVRTKPLKRGVRVEFETTDYQPVIWQSASKWKETGGKIPKSLELFSVPAYGFSFVNSEAADHFARALRHGVELCGRKKSAF
jgi:hypothetical protein